MKVYPYVLYRPDWIILTFEITEDISKTIKKRTPTVTRTPPSEYVTMSHTTISWLHPNGGSLKALR